MDIDRQCKATKYRFIFLHLYRRVWLYVAGEDPDRQAQAENFKNDSFIHIFGVCEA